MEERLRAFEKMLRDIQARYVDTTDKMSRLKRQGKEKTVTLSSAYGRQADSPEYPCNLQGVRIAGLKQKTAFRRFYFLYV